MKDGRPRHHDASQSVAKSSWRAVRNEHRPSLASVSPESEPLIRSETPSTSTSHPPSSSEPQLPFTDKYGRFLEVLHYGTNGTIRLHQCKVNLPGSNSKQLLAVKVYRHNILDSTDPLAQASSCSTTSVANLHPRHPNILPIIDLLYNERSELCLVMPFCPGGDLHGLLSRNGPLPTTEADCLIAQILRALAFLHEHNTAHRDIRLETVLLTERGAVKLAGMGDTHVRRLWIQCATAAEAEEDTTHSQPPPPPSSGSWSFSWVLSSFTRASSSRGGSVGFASSTASFPGMSLPYIPPEGFQRRSKHSEREGDDEGQDDNDPRPADVWATAIIYLALITGRLLWCSACPQREDSRYLEYLHCLRGWDGYPPIEALGQVCISLVYEPCTFFSIVNVDLRLTHPTFRGAEMRHTRCCTLIRGDGLLPWTCYTQSG